MWFLLYNTLLLLALPAILLILISKKRCRPGLAQRVGLFPSRFPFDGHLVGTEHRFLLWVHAVSLGEVVAAAPVIRLFHQRHPTYRIVVSTITETGREAVEQRLAGIAEHCYAPLDYSWVVTRFIDRIRPTAFVFIETELWPNTLKALAQRSIPVLLINGRLSTSSYAGYSWIRSFWRIVLGQVTCFLMQSDRDAARMMALGAPAHLVHTTGNIKFDQTVSEHTEEDLETFRQALALQADDELIVAGSTHPGEEDILLEGYRALHREFPHLVLMLAPRHVERSEELENHIRALHMQVKRRSEQGTKPVHLEPSSQPRVIILDTRGELVMAYRHALLAFVGGTFVPVGGHNLLEPALWSRPVFFGTFTDHVSDVARLLIDGGGGVQVATRGELITAMGVCLRDRAKLQIMGNAARQVIEENQGALGKTVDMLGQILSNPVEWKSQAQARAPEPSRQKKPLASPLFRYQYAGWLRPFLLLLSLPYGLVARWIRLFHQRGWIPQKTLPHRVVSVGNLTVGGTGKTPLVIMFVGLLEAQGKRVGVLSRGYGRRNSHRNALVSDGNAILLDPSEAGDEPFLIAQRCPHAVVAVGADRYQLGQWVLTQCPVDCFLLDDGFQHRALGRRENILVVDGSDPNGLLDVVPAGRLREPVSSAIDATMLVITRVDPSRDWRVDFAPLLAWIGPHCPTILTRFRAEHLINVSTGDVQPLEILKRQPVAIFSGVGNPLSFRRVVEELGAKVVAERIFSDHHVYTQEDMNHLDSLSKESGATIMVTSEKDAVKVSSLAGSVSSLFSIRIHAEILEGQEHLVQVGLD